MNTLHTDRFFGTLVAVAAFFFVSLGDAFLLAWDIQAGARNDIAARGSWLLAAMLPVIAVAVAMLMVVVALLAGHRRRVPVVPRIVSAIGATMLAFVMLYMMPFDGAWVVISPVRQLIGLRASLVLDMVLIAIALRFAFKRDDGAVLEPQRMGSTENRTFRAADVRRRGHEQ